MNEKVLKVLEFDRIREKLVAHATSDPGRRRCAELVPIAELPLIERALRETEDAVARIFRKGSTNFGNTRDFSGIFRALAIGSSIDIASLLALADFLDNVKRVAAYGKLGKDEPVHPWEVSSRTRGNKSRDRDTGDEGADGQEQGRDSLSDLFEGLEPCTQVAQEIRRCIISEDEVADDASPALRNIRREMGRTGERIHSELQKFINGSSRDYLQDSVITMRGDRYCIPVRAEHKGQVSGIVHDQSSSGSTLFIEPAAVVELNNKLRELELSERAEIEEILKQLSGMAGGHLTAISDDAHIMEELDFIFAKASLALEQNATIPVFNEERYFDLKKARHPLIDPKKAVPIDVRAGRDFDMLIITGPNTGGKTVTLKTVGLLTLMGQAGLAIPAGDKSELSVFNEIYADIGDEQSIEQSLSTFSSHMKNTVKILAEADDRSLCIFDELGAGTDPVEGAALAIAILEDLHGRGIRTLATTHYSELKVYALTTEGVQNASCEFDVETLSPTYRLLIGIPGKSNAFAISRRLGLPESIIDAAGKRVGSDEKRFEDLLADLNRSRVTIEREQATIEAYRHEMEKLKAEISRKQSRIDESRAEILRKAEEEARDILQEAKETADETIRVMRREGGGLSMQEAENARNAIGQKLSDRNKKLSESDAMKKKKREPGKKLKADEIKQGDNVRIVSMGFTGTVNTKPDKAGNLFVTCGVMKIKANLADLEKLPEEDGREMMKKFYSSDSHKMDLSRSMNVRTEINLIGMNSEDALASLDKYLDDAYLSHLPSVRIVHGKGSGILRRAVQEHLAAIPYVKSYKLGEFGEGDSGVTIAKLDVGKK